MTRLTTNTINTFRFIVLSVSFFLWILAGGHSSAQTPADGEPDSPPVIQEGTSPTEEQDEVIERGIIRDHWGKGKRLPQRERRLPPPETSSPIIRDHAIQPDIPSLSQTPTLQFTLKVTSPSIVGPATGTVAPADRYTAPTANLTMIANAIQLRHKSLTTIVTAAPNLPVKQPVEISIGYYSPAGNQRITQSYVPTVLISFLERHKKSKGIEQPSMVPVSYISSTQLLTLCAGTLIYKLGIIFINFPISERQNYEHATTNKKSHIPNAFNKFRHRNFARRDQLCSNASGRRD